MSSALMPFSSSLAVLWPLTITSGSPFRAVWCVVVPRTLIAVSVIICLPASLLCAMLAASFSKGVLCAISVPDCLGGRGLMVSCQDRSAPLPILVMSVFSAVSDTSCVAVNVTTPHTPTAITAIAAIARSHSVEMRLIVFRCVVSAGDSAICRWLKSCHAASTSTGLSSSAIISSIWASE